MKKLHVDSGPVISVIAEADGRVGIVVDNGQIPRLLLWAPGSMSEGQYNALKDAFERGLMVNVVWQQTNAGIFVVSVTVYGPPPK